MVTPNTTSLTRCPVCRKGVSDLSHHFAMEHEDSTARPVTKIARSTVTRIIPIVLPNQPCKYLLVLSEIMYVCSTFISGGKGSYPKPGCAPVVQMGFRQV